MKTVFTSELKPLLEAFAEQTELYVPKKSGEYYTYTKYKAGSDEPLEFNNIRTCTTVKEFLFPVCELAATYPEPTEPKEIRQFAVFGLKDCDLHSMAVLDKVFFEEDFRDALYIKRREKMFTISSDCFDPAETCFCTLFGGKSFAEKGFDLNVSKVQDGFIIEAGSEKGEEFISKNSGLFSEVPAAALTQRDEGRVETEKQLKQNNVKYKLDADVKEIVESSQDSEAYDTDSQSCVECQACTRICPTCHCFYLYDTKQSDYFSKMKMWDSCIRCSYATVAGGENPRKVLGDRIKHRFMHKFVYFMDRYGTNMCVGCGRCLETCIGGTDTRELLKKLSDEFKTKK
ncbi:MAG: 4Fe-4S dicluster domain-containing protein [Planctomycetes bacterium]|nr:4Fe-4S dicluster domain-containing protein [Planctomycetota bacterium]